MFQLYRKNSNSLFLVAALFLLTACSNLPFVKQNKAASRIFLADFATAWTAALEAASAGKDIVKIQNRETGIIETNWIDNSASRQFLDVFSDENFFLRMRYKLQIHVREGKKNDQLAVLVRVIKHQQEEATFLGGWQELETDGIEESVYLYRIGRLIAIQQHTEEQEQNRRKIDDGDTFF